MGGEYISKLWPTLIYFLRGTSLYNSNLPQNPPWGPPFVCMFAMWGCTQKRQLSGSVGIPSTNTLLWIVLLCIRGGSWQYRQCNFCNDTLCWEELSNAIKEYIDNPDSSTFGKEIFCWDVAPAPAPAMSLYIAGILPLCRTCLKMPKFSTNRLEACPSKSIPSLNSGTKEVAHHLLPCLWSHFLYSLNVHL
jgi:hypothetical protein